MVQSIFVRVQQVLSAGAESVTDAAERLTGGSLMREAIRQVERAEDEARESRDGARNRASYGQRQRQILREQLAKLEEQARFALAKERPDLAEAAIARQLVLEAEVEQLSVAQKLALDEVEEIELCLTALRLRKDEMVKELAAFEASRRALSPPSAAPGPAGRAGLRAAQAETLFERVRAANVGFSPRPIEGDQAAKLAEVDRLQREATVAKRLDALLKAPASKVTGKRRKVS